MTGYFGLRSNRGRPLEELITIANAQYRAQRIALIHKVPTAWIPLRGSDGRISSAKVAEKAAVDFIGVYRGLPIAIEAKHSSGDRIAWSRVTEHQARFLDDWQAAGGIGFVIVSFGMRRFFIAPWKHWREAGELSASWRPGQFEGSREIPLGGRVPLDYLRAAEDGWLNNAIVG
ncbi:Holliday junction resolvase RecU [Candidatus Igneacidithiobacillus taiwanensis]|uniref:Holliday junction resolvase RecU n=1 Tax=Candidatus Igneacidithiobacillus taiwanensis TaxID=1945924 RepID=UPI002897D59A|nr:Holliday junction resolvase RecU [Candidatus Igneacidithiobacillus taiwanensis]